MAPAGVYDDIAGWYEEEFLGGRRTEARARGGNPLDLGHVLRDLLGEGSERLPGGRVRHRCPRRPDPRAGLDPGRRRPLRRDAAARPRPPSHRAGRR